MGTHYETLGVAVTAGQEEIQAAYRRRARVLNLDRLQGAPAYELARAERSRAQLDEALKVLGDPARRAEYDASIGVEAGGDPGGQGR